MELESNSYELESDFCGVGVGSSRVMEFESNCYGVGVRALWSWTLKVNEFESQSYGV